jgi:NhaP-type Na+/H+ or K+/H+ antiporter
MPVAHTIVRIQRRQFIAWCAVSGAVGLWVAFLIADHYAPMPTLIAATRTNVGTFFMILSGFVGGAVYAWLSRYFRQQLVKKIRAKHRAAKTAASASANESADTQTNPVSKPE